MNKLKKSLIDKRKSYYGESPARSSVTSRAASNQRPNALERYKEAQKKAIKKPIVVYKNKAMILRD